MNKTNLTALPIHITPHHLTLSPALSAFVREKFAKIPRFAKDVLATNVVLRLHHGTSDGKRFSASGRLALAGRDIHATATHADLYTAIVKLVARLARRSRKRKTRLAKTYAATRPSSWKSLQNARELFTGNSSTPEGVMPKRRTARPRSGGQEQRVFWFRRSAPIAASRA